MAENYIDIPRQKIAASSKTKSWGKANIDYFEQLAYTTSTGNRTSNAKKLINYDLFNGKFDRRDLEYVSNPYGFGSDSNMEFPANLQHYDIISPAIMLLLGEEIKRPDNAKVIAEDSDSISRKEEIIADKLKAVLKEALTADFDPEDQEGLEEQMQKVLKYERYSSSDLIEITSNRILSYLKRNLDSKLIFNRGWKDALVAGEEIYWVGIQNGEPTFRRCNPPDIAVVLDGDSDFIDDAVAVIETRVLHPATILDEFGDDLEPSDVKKIEDLSRTTSSRTNQNPPITIGNADRTVPDFSNFQSHETGSVVEGHIRVVRVEWMSMRKEGIVKYTDENGMPQEEVVDETFTLLPEMEEDGWEVEWYWVNEPYEGVKIGEDLYVGIRPKQNQRRRLDNPYYCRLGYSGLIYNATNSVSVSLVDRLKPYQYLYNILMYRLELAFASDMGKVMLMDLAQVPRSEGMDMDQWIYYLKAMKIAFINSHEEGKRGSRTGQVSNFNQFQSIDLGLANTIQQYINSLEYIKQQIFFLSGITPQRLGEVQASELVGNVQNSLNQSANITEYWFEAHNKVKERVYTGLIECAKIAWRDGKKVQYVLDDMGMEVLNIDGLDFENSEFSVFVSNSSKDQHTLDTMKSLFQSAIQADKATLSDIASIMAKDSTQEISRLLEQREKEKADRDAKMIAEQNKLKQSEIESRNKQHEEQMEDRQADRDLKRYEIDTNNETKIQTATINAYRGQKGLDQDGNGIPDPIELQKIALKEREMDSKAFMEDKKRQDDKEKKEKELSLKEEEMKNKKEIEDKKIEQIKVQNKSQEEINERNAKLKEKELKLKEKELAKKARENKNKK